MLYEGATWLLLQYARAKIRASLGFGEGDLGVVRRECARPRGLLDQGAQSLSYISLINAIDVLAPSGLIDPCPTCVLNRAPGPTTRFRETVERYAGELPERKALYDLRSRLVHGDQILLGDRPSGWGFTPQQEEERSRHELASRVARVVIIAWLFAAASAAEHAY